MRYESARTPKGNIGVSYESQAAAEAQAAAMDSQNCTNCTDCTDCTDCTNCRYCTDCTDCTNCRYCAGCTDCTDCTDCTNCTDCTDCTNCTDCTGVLRWEGAPASKLLALNGLRWPVAVSETQIQIGCQCHTIEQWAAFDDAQISEMEFGALKFWKRYKDLILSLTKGTE